MTSGRPASISAQQIARIRERKLRGNMTVAQIAEAVGVTTYAVRYYTSTDRRKTDRTRGDEWHTWELRVCAALDDGRSLMCAAALGSVAPDTARRVYERWLRRVRRI